MLLNKIFFPCNFVLQVHVKRSFKGRHEDEDDLSRENGSASPDVSSFSPLILRKSKLVVVDLSGSERINKSGIWYKLLVIYFSVQSDA